MATENANRNMSAAMAEKIFAHFCKDTKQVRAYILEIASDLGLSRTDASRISVRELANFIPHVEEEEQEEVDGEEVNDEEGEDQGGAPEEEEKEDEEEEEEGWEWDCCEKWHFSTDKCDCGTWCCNCNSGCYHKSSLAECKRCGVVQPE